MIISFIGAGKMAEALIARLGPGTRSIASDVNKSRLNFLCKKYRITSAENNLEAFSSAPVVVLAVKPQNITEVLYEIRTSIRENRKSKIENRKLVVSIAAGIPISYLQKKLPGISVIRAMPNNPCLVGKGITAIAKGSHVNSYSLLVARKIFGRVGEVIEVPEKWMDAVTGLSGSGPAFVYLVIEALTQGGVAAGLPRKVAEKLALRTVAGAAETVRKTGRTPKELREMVTSPGGTTIEGLKVLKKYQTTKAFALAVRAAAKKSKALSKKWTL